MVFRNFSCMSHKNKAVFFVVILATVLPAIFATFRISRAATSNVSDTLEMVWYFTIHTLCYIYLQLFHFKTIVPYTNVSFVHASRQVYEFANAVISYSSPATVCLLVRKYLHSVRSNYSYLINNTFSDTFLS